MENIKLDLIPGKKMPSLHASQYDDGREHGIDLFENGVVYKLDGTETLTINERKGDDCICSLDIENTFIGTNHIVFASTEQMCAVWGNNICELVIAKGEKTIGTLNFIFEIEPSPTENGVESESEIKNLNRQVDERIDEVLPEQIAEKVPQAVDDYIGDKYYDKEQTDELLDDKANKDETYTKEEVDELLPEKTASGVIATFETEISKPMSFKAYIEAVQASGTPTPATPLPISGWSEISLVKCGANLWNEVVELGALDSDGTLNGQTTRITTDFIPVKPNQTYRQTSSSIAYGGRICFYDKNKSCVRYDGNGVRESTKTFTTQDGEYYVRITLGYQYGTTYNNDISINYPSSDTAYHAYKPNGNTEVINLGGTYYGGHFTQDKAGHRQLTVTYGIADISELSWNRYIFSGVYCFYVNMPLMKTNFAKGLSSAFEFKSNIYNPNALSNNQFLLDNGTHNGYCYLRCDDYSDADSFKTAMSGQKLIYELATPIVIDLPDGEPLNALVGVNNVFADSGNIEVTYKESLIEYTDKALDNKANVSDVYNKTEINNALALKADQSEFEGDVTYNKNLVVLENRTTSDKVNLTSSNGTKAFITGSNIIYCPDITVGSPVYNPKDLFVPFTVYIAFVVSSDFAQSSAVWSIYVAWKDGTKRYISSNSASNVKKLVATYDNPIVEIYARSTNMTAGSITKICFTKTEGEQYQAYNGKSVVLPANNVALYNGINNIWSDGEKIAVTIHLFDGRIASIENDVEGLISETEPIVSEFNKFELPSYYFANNYIQNKVARINELAKAAVGNGDAFIFIIDQHWSQNAKKSPALINYVYKNTHINTVFNGGDSGEGGSEAYVNLLNEAFGGKKLHATGNHDYYGSGDDSNLYYLLDMYNNDEIGSPQEHYYYYDNNQAKIRYIVLNSDGSAAYSNDQLTWFTAAMNVNNGWGIVIIVHWLFMVNWSTNVCALGSVIAQPFLDAINNYSGNGEIIAVIQGHVHRDRITFTQTNGVPVIITTCDKYVTSESGGAHDIDVTRELGTTSEQAFDVYIINRGTKTIDVIRIGAKAKDGIGNDPGDEVEERQVNWT